MAKKKEDYKKPSRLLLYAAVFCGTLVTALLSFISFELALLSFGVFAIGAMLYAENRRRGFWESAASFKFKVLKESQDTLSKDTKTNSDDIDDLKKQVMRLRMDMTALGKKHGNSETKTEAEPAPQAPPPLPFEMEIAPEPEPLRAIKPQDIATQAMQEPKYDDVSDAVVKELLKHAVHQKQIEVFVQPVVRLPQRQVRFYEMFARVRARPGQYLPAGRYMKIAEQDNMDGQIDSLLLLHCLKTIQGSAHVKRAAPFFINIKRSTLTNKPFMQRLLGFLSKNRHLAPRLIFEIPQKGFENMPPPMLEILRGLGQLGCSFSLDHVTDLKMNIADLQHYKVRFIKLDAQLLSGSQSGDRSFAEIHRHKRKLEANGIGVIATKIEHENDMRDLLDFDVHYGQGYLFGKPELEGAYKKRARAKRTGEQEDAA